MSSALVREAASALAGGSLVAFPTETVFGLGADAFNPAAVGRIFTAKGRPSNHPLIVHVSGVDRLRDVAAEVTPMAAALAEAFWPGPMTVILRRAEAVPLAVTGGQETIGVRVPNHQVALELLRAFEEIGGRGVAAPSANRFGRVSPTTAAAVRAELADVLDANDVILDGEQSAVGIESTIIDCTGPSPVILRPGAITTTMVEGATGLTLAQAATSVRVSGSLPSHYAPNAEVVVDGIPEPGDGLIAMREYATPAGVVRLAAPASPEEYAHDLYAALRAADAHGLPRVVAITPSGTGIVAAIRDRLARASHPTRP